MAAILVTLAVAELAMRLFGIAGGSAVVRFVGVERAAQDTTWDPDLLWRLVARGGYDRIDAIGVRGESYTSPRDPHDFRVLCVGDSCTYGLLVLLDESFGMVLDRGLQKRLPAANVETVLAACPGYSTFQNVAMCRRHAADFAADVTVLYVGAWNDMSPVGTQTDSEFGAVADRLERHPFWSLRLARLYWHATHPQPTEEEARRRIEAAWTPGTQTAVRVSLDEFRTNVRELVSIARRTGVVVAVVPSIQNETRGMPWTNAYRRALVDAYRELAVPCVDSDEAFRAYAARHGMDPAPANFLSDAVHPTAIGHAAIGEALDPVVAAAAEEKIRALQGTPAAKPLTIASLEPTSVAAGRRATLRMRGAGYRGPAPPVRVLLNDQSTPFRIVDDATVELFPEPEFLSKPGTVALVARTRAGPRPAPQTLEILPWAVRAEGTSRDGARAVRVCVDCESGLWVGAIVSRGTLATPRQTLWGPFRLVDPRGDLPDSRFTSLTGLTELGLPLGIAVRTQPEPTPICAEVALPSDFTGPLFVQVLVRWGMAPESAWLSDVLAIDAPR